MISINLFFPLMFHPAAEWDPTFRHHSHSTTLELQDGKITSKVPFYYGGEGLMFHKRKMFLPRAFAERFIEALKCAVSGGHIFVFHFILNKCFVSNQPWYEIKPTFTIGFEKKDFLVTKVLYWEKPWLETFWYGKKYNSWEKYTCRWYFPIYFPLSG